VTLQCAISFTEASLMQTELSTGMSFAPWRIVVFQIACPVATPDKVVPFCCVLVEWLTQKVVKTANILEECEAAQVNIQYGAIVMKSRINSKAVLVIVA
jgi:hypothetical protein